VRIVIPNMAKVRKSDPWKRCWRGKIPRAKRIIIYDSNERMVMVDSRQDRFFDKWLEASGGRIMFYMLLPEPPFETIPLFPEEEVAA
jgi:hypothetical protein